MTNARDIPFKTKGMQAASIWFSGNVVFDRSHPKSNSSGITSKARVSRSFQFTRFDIDTKPHFIDIL